MTDTDKCCRKIAEQIWEALDIMTDKEQIAKAIRDHTVVPGMVGILQRLDLWSKGSKDSMADICIDAMELLTKVKGR